MTDEQVRALRKAFIEFGEAARDTTERVLAVGRKIREGLYAEYERRGCPYGRGDDGFLRWVREEGHRANAQAEREYERDRHEAMQAFRQTLAERREQ